MTEQICLCLSCGSRFGVFLRTDADLERKACPRCGGNNLVKYNPESFFGSIFGGYGGG